MSRAWPGPDREAEALRRAYLDLLKLAVCDLVGPSTVSVGAMPDGTVMSRELRGEARKMRAAGLDWPLQGLTMVGLPASTTSSGASSRSWPTACRAI